MDATVYPRSNLRYLGRRCGFDRSCDGASRLQCSQVSCKSPQLGAKIALCRQADFPVNLRRIIASAIQLRDLHPNLGRDVRPSAAVYLPSALTLLYLRRSADDPHATTAAEMTRVAEGEIMSESSVSFRSRSGVQLFAALSAFGLCVTAAVGGGFWLGSSRNSHPLPLLNAATAASSSTMAVATGQISDNAEGIFFLDFITGDLQCLVYYPQMGTFGARYYTNVLQQLPGTGRNSQFLLVTGTSISIGSSGGPRPGNSLVYVTDATSGMFAAYAVPWDRTAESGRRLQSGPLVFAGGGPIRNFQLRDNPAPAANQPAAVKAPAAGNPPAPDPNKKK